MTDEQVRVRLLRAFQNAAAEAQDGNLQGAVEEAQAAIDDWLAAGAPEYVEEASA